MYYMSKITKILFLSLVAFLSTSLVFTSCKKEDDEEVVVVEKTPTEKLIGTWKLNKSFEDGEEIEINPDEIFRIIFQTNTNGLIRYVDPDESDQLFEWFLLENNTKIRFTINEDGDILSYDFMIKKLSESDFWIISDDQEEQQFIKE